jgi:hypothetical protein
MMFVCPSVYLCTGVYMYVGTYSKAQRILFTVRIQDLVHPASVSYESEHSGSKWAPKHKNGNFLEIMTPMF